MWENSDMLFYMAGASRLLGWGATALYIASMTGYITYLFVQREKIQDVAFFLISLGFFLHLASIVLKSLCIGSLPAFNLEQTLLIAGLALAGVFKITRRRLEVKVLGVFVSPLLVLIMIAAILVPATPAEKTTILKGFWLYSHIVLVFIGEAALALACGAAILYLIQEKGIKAKKQGFFFKRLPSLDLLDSASYVFVLTGFVMLTVGLITGFVYAKAVWGTFWSWDPKEVWSVATWLIYAALIHFRFVSGWQGRKSAIMTIAGFCVLMFTFLGVNLLIGGHHQTFTK